MVLFIRSIRTHWIGSDSLPLLYALTVLATALLNPHFFLYDGVVLFLPALVLLNTAPESPIVRLLLTGAYITTATTDIRYLVFGHAPAPLALAGAPVTALLIFGLFLVAVRRCSGSTASLEATASPMAGALGG